MLIARRSERHGRHSESRRDGGDAGIKRETQREKNGIEGEQERMTEKENMNMKEHEHFLSGK